MDKSWMYKSRLSQEYEHGVEEFLKFAFDNASQDGMIVCPCIKCVNIHWRTREAVLEHLICDGILQGYTCWFFHGERVPSHTTNISTTVTDASILNSHNITPQVRKDGMDELLRDAFNMHQVDQETSGPNICNTDVEVNVGDGTDRGVDDEPSPEAAKFYKLLIEMNEKLYEGSKHSRLYFCIRLFHLKCMCGMTGKGLDLLIEFLKEFFPSAAIPRSSHDSKKVIKDLGLGYDKIHSCPNDCMLYWDLNEHQQSCHVCGHSRWVSNDPKQSLDDDGDIVNKRPAKVLRYFPLIPRLQRIFMSSKTAADMVWHVTGRSNDGCLRHLAIAEAWKSFDARYPDFCFEPRENVRAWSFFRWI
ncbi:uncharacterized protein LOC120256938 [Dioscorea cayenensis subsp. rotundata]|uniref:Uncharacterized protein LOC120256938 n=1 Tax=Dioscorea cayennensis subsp. rotundata TaxID=55577 RepID=A0AB40B1A2_DIOCR|nr:uncharacterized protein LOC120256938 [Dioscorea cayenensis subsp. rotundata]